MDYCYDPNAPISLSSPSTDPPVVSADAQTQAEASAEAFVGCSAEIRFCPGGKVIYQDPKNNCEFPSCSNPGPNNENYVATTTSTTITTSPPETVAAFDGSSYFCGYSLTQVNGNCVNAKLCDLGLDTQCDGLEVCIGDTSCGGSPPATVAAADAAVVTTTTSATTATSGEQTCDDLCLDILPSEFCPSDLNLPKCLEVEPGEVCEGDGSCATDELLNNCAPNFDVYVRVLCGQGTPSQGQIMRETMPPTPSPSSLPTLRPTLSPVTLEPTLSPITYTPTIDAAKMEMAMQSAASSSSAVNDEATATADSNTPVSIAEAIANATANAAALQQSPSSEVPITTELPPIEEYESNIAATFTYDRNPSSGEVEDEDVAAVSSKDEAGVGSNEWYTTVYNNDAEASSDSDNEHVYDGWNLDSYFRPASANAACLGTERRRTLGGAIIIGGIVAAFLTG